ncbi:hypothetical protein HMPREF2978_06585 [Corynebacterium sp. HMSC074C01]|uniref:hypothetical protein n=1 Tax=Corynebacterium sp. HMSC074C01 TaxID=1739482 RepID=UPI0008A306C0|nr:hypothetical protein [Corynebacterium sp. HMSC074C01]OFP65917.1 hypothetical protein HMPREF2978_06585 [Corynebacterium sp. HMSC074C01]
MVIGFVVGGLMIAITGLSYGFSIRALPLTGSGVAFAMATLGRTHAFIAGWTIYLPEVAICSLFHHCIRVVEL